MTYPFKVALYQQLRSRCCGKIRSPIHERETRLAALNASIARGLADADADAGRVGPVDAVFDRLEAKCRAIGTGRHLIGQRYGAVYWP